MSQYDYQGQPYSFKANPKYGRDQDEWGMKVFTDTDDAPAVGSVVRVTTKAGEERFEHVGEVVWSGENKFGEGWVHACKFAGKGSSAALEGRVAALEKRVEALENGQPEAF